MRVARHSLSSPLFSFRGGCRYSFWLPVGQAGERALQSQGDILLGPVQLYFSWRHRTETGVFDGSFPAFVVDKAPQIGPKWFGAYGYHMWFLGFLFAFSLLALPIFVWLHTFLVAVTGTSGKVHTP